MNLVDTKDIEPPEAATIENRADLVNYMKGLSVRKISSIHENNKVFVKLLKFDFEPGIEHFIPPQQAQNWSAVPLMLYEGTLIIAVPENSDQYSIIKNIEFASGKHIEAIPANAEEIEFALGALYTAEELIGLSETIDIEKIGPRHDIDTSEKIAEKPLVELVKRIIFEAIKKNASDIHIKPTEDDIEYLLRIDGNMTVASRFDMRYLNPLISRFKIIGGMNIAEHRLPQDGGAKLSINDRLVEVRMSILPTIHGESLVVRLLQTDATLFTIDDLNMSEHDFDLVLKGIHQSNGLILACGPTGSGKSTTLYALLQEIKKNPNLNIITVEDPVEFHIDEIEQIQINRKTGYTFSSALRNILRHDPDVIMLGEIRDQETGKTAIECALTGHLVLSTLHSVNAISTVTRLLEMGIKPYLLKSTLSTVIAQRLAKLNCPECLEDDDTLLAQHLSSDKAFSHIHWKKGSGCKHCHNTGLKGRKAIFEVLHIDKTLCQVISEDVTEEQLEEAASQQLIEPLASKAIQMAETGQISADEFIRLRIE